MKLIKVKFIKDEETIPYGKEYTYFTSDDSIIVGDIVDINSNSKGVVTNVNVSYNEVKSFIDKLKVIKGKSTDKPHNDLKDQEITKIYESDDIRIEIIKKENSFCFTCNLYEKNKLIKTRVINNSQGFNEVLYWFLNVHVFNDANDAFNFFFKLTN